MPVIPYKLSVIKINAVFHEEREKLIKEMFYFVLAGGERVSGKNFEFLKKG